MSRPAITPEEAQMSTTPRRRWLVGALGLAVVVGLSIPVAFAARGPGGFGHGCDEGPATAEEAREHAGWFTEKALDRVDATDDQRASIEATLDGAVPTLFALKGEGRDLKDDMHDALLADQVDAAQVEALRAEAVQLADRASRQVADTVLKIASVLTAEQRAELAKLHDR